LTPDSERCPQCGEWWAWHHIVSELNDVAVMRPVDGIRHRPECRAVEAQERMFRLYNWSWVDAPPPPGALGPGDEAWKMAGVPSAMLRLPLGGDTQART
jgi:hypothetical protein